MDNYQIPIRTIKVKPYDSTVSDQSHIIYTEFIIHFKYNWNFQMENNVKEYFAQFGKIDSVEVYSKNSIQCGFVEFEVVDGATAALSNATHRISGYDVTVEAAEPWHQPDQILNALDDDCLREIFKYFELNDLTNTADVCNRFKKCAEDAFSNKYKTVNLDGDDTDVLINFGKLIRSLNIDFDVFSVFDRQKFINLDMINEYTCHKLEELSISSLRSSETLINPLLFVNLKHIELEYCTNPNLNQLLKVCPKLEILKIKSCGEIENCLNQRFEQLKEFHLVNSTENVESINTFIITNSSLTKLKWVNSFPHMRSIGLIGQHLQRLVELELGLESGLLDLEFEREEPTGFEASLQILSNLNSLKALKLSFKFNEPWSIAPLLNALATNQSPLELILLNNAEITDAAIESMSELKQLNRIQLDNVDGLTNDHVIQLSKELPNLQHFCLKGDSGEDITVTALKTMIRYSMKLSRIEISKADSISINSSDYFTMLEIIQKRPDKIQLSIILTGHGDIVNVPEEIVAQNREYLLIDEHIYSDSGDEFVEHDIDNDTENFDYDHDYDYAYGYDYDDERGGNSSPDSDCYRRWAD